MQMKNTGNMQETRAHSLKRGRVTFFLSHGIFICGLTEMIAAHAMTPQDIYRQAEHQVFVLEVLDKKGGVVRFGHGGSL